MNLTLWSLVLAAAGAILFFGRRKWLKKVETKKLDQVKRKKKAEEDEADRLACLDLGKSLMSSVPSSRPEGASRPGGAAKSSS